MNPLLSVKEGNEITIEVRHRITYGRSFSIKRGRTVGLLGSAGKFHGLPEYEHNGFPSHSH